MDAFMLQRETTESGSSYPVRISGRDSGGVSGGANEGEDGARSQRDAAFASHLEASGDAAVIDASILSGTTTGLSGLFRATVAWRRTLDDGAQRHEHGALLQSLLLDSSESAGGRASGGELTSAHQF
jgi:hypothetical protein